MPWQYHFHHESGTTRRPGTGAAGSLYLPNRNKQLIHIEAAPPIDFGFDANANIITESSRTYVYDLSNQLIRVLDNANQVAEYTYNGAGQRIKKVTQTETRIFHYDLRGHLIAETNQAGQMLAEYVYLGDQLLAMIKPGESVYYFHNDHLGTPQVLTDDGQAIAWKAVYTPFGQAVPSIQTVENPFRFPGQYYDPETGLHYNYFRYYNPQTGRYMTPDPIGLEGGINLFVYVANSPMNRTDPRGLMNINYAGIFNIVKGGWQVVAKAMSIVGLDTSAAFLNHSLKDNPGPLNGYTGATKKILNSPEFISAMASIRPGEYNDWVWLNPIFETDTDLSLALHDVDLYYKGKKGGPCQKDNLQIHIWDKYNFHPSSNLGVEAAFISQNIGIIKPFEINIYFSYP